jgi:hypothetical protein
MLQRIQTVYLLITAALFVALFFVPVATLQSGGDAYIFDVTGLNSIAEQPELITPTWSLLALAGIITVITFSIIFLYKRRVLQIRLCVFNSLIIIGFSVLTAYYLWQLSKSPSLPGVKIIPSVWCALPIIALIFNYLAIRKIGIDEALVRSLERLR